MKTILVVLTNQKVRDLMLGTVTKHVTERIEKLEERTETLEENGSQR